MAAAVRAAADRREGLARLVGQVGSARTRLETREAEIGRLASALDQARERAAAAHAEFTALESRVAGLDEGEVGLDTEHEQAAAAYEAAQAHLVQLRQDEREAERDRAALAARKEALELGLTRKDGAAALLAAGDRLSGVLGLGRGAGRRTTRLRDGGGRRTRYGGRRRRGRGPGRRRRCAATAEGRRRRPRAGPRGHPRCRHRYGGAGSRRCSPPEPRPCWTSSGCRTCCCRRCAGCSGPASS